MVDPSLRLIGADPLVIGAWGWVGDAARGPALSSDVCGLLRVITVELTVFALVLGLAGLRRVTQS